MSDTDFPLVDQLQEAGTQAAMAALLLRVPDALILSHGIHLQGACQALGFPAGVEFVLSRSVAMHAVRDAHGLMPVAMVTRLEAYREGLSRLAAGNPG